MKLSLVIPVYNEDESLAKLYDEICEVVSTNNYDAEIIFIDDGSKDDSWKVVSQLVEKDPRIRGLKFRRNFGKAAGLDAGFQEAQGDVIITMDADLQDDPHEIPRFLEQLDAGYDVISGWKQVRHDPWHKVGPSRVFNWMVSTLTGVKLHDHNCGMKCYRGEIFDEVRLYGELHRFVPVLAAAHGWKVGEIVINHRARQFGHSKYGVRRFLKGFLDLTTVAFITGYGQRPQHLLGGIGLLFFALGFVGLFGLSGWWVLDRLIGAEEPIELHKRAIFYYSIVALLLGTQFVTVGLLAEIIRSATAPQTKSYFISQKVGVRDEAN
ncbi:glycosyltransferase family 2 protein [Bremerella sp. JC770]|uniref:glycosyltransferase family 2 protein n=1 Tax=Bremerella sp. JC770 TaxID=3232137 RepID=UPI003457E343